MKKLMVMLVAVATAVCVKAASVDWAGYTVVGGEVQDYSYLVDKDGNKTSLGANQSIVLVSLTAGSDLSGTWSVKSELSTATIGSDKEAYGYFSFTYGTSNPIADGDVLAVVLKDGDSYANLTYQADGSKVTDTMVVSGLSTDQDLWAKEFQFATNGNFVAAPEPTSGLLLLLGVAGLALKRKHA